MRDRDVVIHVSQVYVWPKPSFVCLCSVCGHVAHMTHISLSVNMLSIVDVSCVHSKLNSWFSQMESPSQSISLRV